ncbi:sulfatase-like hydrolase/transferase [Streptomyces collinus]
MPQHTSTRQSPDTPEATTGDTPAEAEPTTAEAPRSAAPKPPNPRAAESAVAGEAEGPGTGEAAATGQAKKPGSGGAATTGEAEKPGSGGAAATGEAEKPGSGGTAAEEARKPGTGSAEEADATGEAQEPGTGETATTGEAEEPGAGGAAAVEEAEEPGTDSAEEADAGRPAAKTVASEAGPAEEAAKPDAAATGGAGKDPAPGPDKAGPAGEAAQSGADEAAATAEAAPPRADEAAATAEAEEPGAGGTAATPEAAPPRADEDPAHGTGGSDGRQAAQSGIDQAVPAGDAPAPGAGEAGPTPATTGEAHPTPAAVAGAGGVRARWLGRTARWRDAHPAAARGLSVAVTVLAAALVVAALVLPNTVVGLRPAKFVRLPAEAVIGAAVMLALPRRPRVVLAAVSGVALAAMTVLNLLDMGFNQYLGRSFNLVLDWSLLGDAQSYLEDSLGRTATLAATAGLIVVVLLLFVLLALSMVRLSDLLARHTGTATRGTLVAGVVWITCSSLGLQISGVPIASDRTAAALKIQAHRVSDTLRDEAEFRKVARVDAFGDTPGAQLVPDLRGKDMIFTFIESYGRSAIEDPIIAPGVDKTLDERTAALAKAGFHARSGWLTSATYGGSSWLGHSTTMSGLWVSNQQRYRTVMASDHLSLTKAFEKTGAFDTVGVMPGVQKAWPEQSFYGLNKVYNAFELGYKGPKFSWSTMPDQYALQQYQDRVHSKKPADGKSRMSLLILTSSHQPWAPIPKMVGWDQLGDGSVFKGIQAAGNKPADIIADTTRSRQEYGKSVQYSVTALTQWLERYGDKDTVLVFLGDHQPIARVSGNHASRDVPVAIVAKDPKVLDKIDGWGWTDGLRPAHDAPVWKMSSFRDRFLTAYGSTPHPKRG